MTNQSTFHATCHCKSSTLSFTVPTSSLPLRAYFCHCTVCRHVHGTLCSIHAGIPRPTVDLSTFTAYKSSPPVTRFFCTTCGAHLLDNGDGGEDDWYVAVSSVDAGEEIWRFEAHFFVEGTRDEGLAGWVPRVGGRKLKVWKRGTVRLPEFEETGDYLIQTTDTAAPSGGSIAEPAPVQDSNDDKLKVQCHCGDVEFYIARPTADVFDKIPDKSLVPHDKTKWFALHDVCNSCRLVSACAIISWAFPATSHISLPDGTPYRPLFGALKQYKSSPDVTRSFCSTCGAVVFYSHTIREEAGIVDVAVGLLRARSGVRAEEWLEWRAEKVGAREDCRFGEVLEGLEEGLRGWAEKKKQERGE